MKRRPDDEPEAPGDAAERPVATEEPADSTAPGPDAETAASPAGAEAKEESGLEPVEPTPTREAYAALLAERDGLRDQLLRRVAEFDNFKKRVARDREQAAEDALAALLQDLLPSLDNLDRALDTEAGEKALREGVELIRRDLQALLQAQGVEEHAPLGRPFDPRRDQALSHEPAPGHADGTVVEVFRKGYLLRGRLLRPALVKVAKAGDEPDEPAEPETVH